MAASPSACATASFASSTSERAELAGAGREAPCWAGLGRPTATQASLPPSKSQPVWPGALERQWPSQGGGCRVARSA